MKILFVDDYVEICEISKIFLEMAGHYILTANTVKESIKIYKENHKKIDLAILDVIMTDGTGIDIYNEILKINPDIKIIFQTGQFNKAIGEIIKENSNTLLILKPYSQQALINKIKSFER